MQPSRPRSRSRSSSAKQVGAPVSAAAQADVVAATFANADLTATRAALNTYYHKYLALDEENQVLRAELAQHDEDSLIVTGRLEQQLEEAHLRYNMYKSEATAIIQRLSESESSLRQHYEAVLAERDRQLSEYADASARLQSDLLQASRYVQQRQVHATELKQLQEQLEEMAEKHEKALMALRFETIDRKMRLMALERTMKEEFQALVDAESARLLEVREAALLQHTRSLEQEKHDMARDIEQLMDLTNLIDGERTQMRRTADVHQQAHREVLRHVAARNRQGRAQELRAQRLEAQVRDLTQSQRTIAQEAAAPYVARIAELESALTTTQDALARHRLELRQTRRLAQRVVAQRTDLERFFLTALEDCRRYRAGLDAAAAATTTSAHSKAGGGATLPLSVRRKPGPSPSASRLATGRGQAGATPAATLGMASAGDTFFLTQPSRADDRRQCRQAPASSPRETSGVLPPVRGKPSPPPTPSATLTARPPALPRDDDGGVRFESLPWSDKEKVIKALFFYINATYYSSQAPADDDDDGEDEEEEEEEEAGKDAIRSHTADVSHCGDARKAVART